MLCPALPFPHSPELLLLPNLQQALPGEHQGCQGNTGTGILPSWG